MRFISWNLNGIRAAWNHGLASFLDTANADIYAFQETKVSEAYHPIEIEGYSAFWAFCERRKGYAGTLCLTRYAPTNVFYDMSTAIHARRAPDPESAPFDCEGRIITLEYPEYYFINCYFPNSQGSQERYDYRNQWDQLFYTYIEALRHRKAIIICGDFNVAISDRDIYPENKWVFINSEGYQATEREALHNLIALGMNDSFRILHPDAEGIFSWWSNRRNKRSENKGWRLDYFLVSDEFAGMITAAEVLTGVYGSDHCPITLDLSIDAPAIICPPTRRRKAPKYEIPSGTQQERNAFAALLDNAQMGVVWDSINWDTVEDNIARMQMALAKSAYSHDASLIEKWPKNIVFSIDAKLLAVRHVCSSAGGVGVDRIRWETSKDKMAAAISLTSKNYKAMPSRLLLINAKNGRQRRVHVETWHDRAMQALYAMALDPIAESWGDRKSFAFRRGRSHFDAHFYIKQAFEGEGIFRANAAPAPEWAFIGDVRQCYEHISHQWILDNIPMAKTVLFEFLTAGYLFAGEVYPTNEGVGIGLSLSPIIANMVLDGLQDAIYRAFYPDAYDESIPADERPAIDYACGNLIRYADDLMVITRTQAQAESVRGIIREFLSPRGLELSEQKSKVVNINNGFDFMSRHYIKKQGVIYAYPSEQATERFMQRLRDTVENHTGSQQSLITKLNRKLDGWATYHKVEDSQETFRHVDTYLKAILLQSCEQKHPKWDRQKIIEKYWYRDANGIHQYALPSKREIKVKSLADTLMIYYRPVRTSLNPYIETEYLNWRTNTREIYNVTGIYRAIWERQQGRCHYCGCQMLPDQEKMLIVADNSAYKKVRQYAFIHTRCADCSIEYIDTDTLPETKTDVMNLLEHLQNNSRQKGQKFLPLGEFFRTSTKLSITMTFSEIETILGYTLGKSADQPQWWTRTGFMNISQSWLDNGYEIKRLNIAKRRVTFHQTKKNLSSVNIPDVFFTERIPDEAKYEMENYFSYIVKKYGL